MKTKPLKDAKRRKVWAETKAAAGAYARNPCAATEHLVENAVEHLRHLDDAVVPKSPQKTGGDQTG